MIEELKFILDAIGDLSGIALWVVGGFIAYQLIMYLATTGAVVVLVRLAIERLHSWATAPRQPKIREFGDFVCRICITCDGTDVRVANLLRRLVGKGVGIPTSYLHAESADWLEEAINEKEERERNKPTA